MRQQSTRRRSDPRRLVLNTVGAPRLLGPILLVIAILGLTTTLTKNNAGNIPWGVVRAEEYDDESQLLLNDLEPHPDPNEEDHEGMIYVGRHDPDTGHRLSAHHDNTVRYVFGTAFDDSHYELELEDLRHLPSDGTHPDMPGQMQETQKSREQWLKERRRQQHSRTTEPIPFGHVDTHPLDGGVTPTLPVAVEPFWLDAKPVTNKEFAKFVKSTYYQTEAEKFGWSFVLSSFVDPALLTTPEAELERDPDAEHWVAVPGAYWRQPEGPRSSYKHREHHPVVHVSHRDAAEYCQWRHQRLPGEREWEAAARAGHWSHPDQPGHAIHNRTVYSWGDKGTWDMAQRYANLWGAGSFPETNLAEDGWRGTSPVQHYPPNVAGFYDLTGNVWEWMRGGKNKARIVRGGSFVDSLDGSFNHAATLGARAVLHGTTTTANVGFRCAKAVRRRVEHHWTWHDEEVHGQLSVEDEYGNRKDLTNNDNEPDSDDDEFREKRKKIKVVKKRERLSTEL